MNKEKLLELLSLFKNSRKKLTDDFINENPDIYSSMFEYEENHQLMRLCIEKYFTEYINYHLTFSKKSKNQILHSTNPFVKGF